VGGTSPNTDQSKGKVLRRDAVANRTRQQAESRFSFVFPLLLLFKKNRMGCSFIDLVGISRMEKIALSV